MNHAEIHSVTKARADAGAALGRRMSEYVQAIQLNERKHCSWQYVEIKYAEYKQALDELVFAAQKEGVAQAEDEIKQLRTWIDVQGRDCPSESTVDLELRDSHSRYINKGS